MAVAVLIVSWVAVCNSICNRHKNKFPSERREVQHKSFSYTHNGTRQLEQKITVLEVSILIVTALISIQHLLMILKVLMGRIATELICAMIRI